MTVKLPDTTKQLSPIDKACMRVSDFGDGRRIQLRGDDYFRIGDYVVPYNDSALDIFPPGILKIVEFDSMGRPRVVTKDDEFGAVVFPQDGRIGYGTGWFNHVTADGELICYRPCYYDKRTRQ